MKRNLLIIAVEANHVAYIVRANNNANDVVRAIHELPQQRENPQPQQNKLPQPLKKAGG